MNDTKKPFNFSEKDFEKTLSKEELSGLRKRGFQHLRFKELLRGAPLSIKGKEEREFVNGLDKYLKHRRHYNYYTHPGCLVADYVFYEVEIEKRDVKYQKMADDFLKSSLPSYTYKDYSSALQDLKTTGKPTHYYDALDEIDFVENEKDKNDIMEHFITQTIGGKKWDGYLEKESYKDDAIRFEDLKKITNDAYKRWNLEEEERER